MPRNILSDDEFRRRLLKPLDEIKNESALTEANANSSGMYTSKNSEKDPTTLMKYITNPTGKGSTYVANRSAIKAGLNQTFIKLLREHRKAFYAIPYLYDNGDLLYWVKVPSEFYDDNKISYDVLFLLEFEKDKERKHRNMKVFSNSPSFVYTYCYVYNQHDMLIPRLKSKFPSEALTMPPDVRNPIQSFGYEKSTYIAARYLLDGMCLTDQYVNRFSKNITAMNDDLMVFNKVADPEVLVSIYQHSQYEKRKTHRKELSAEVKKSRDAQKSNYIKTQKAIAPRKSLIPNKSPRSNITARKAMKNIQNSKPLKPKKYGK